MTIKPKMLLPIEHIRENHHYFNFFSFFDFNFYVNYELQPHSFIKLLQIPVQNDESAENHH